MIDPSQRPIRITPHDEKRLQINQSLTKLLSSSLVLPAQHSGHMTDMLDVALGIARVLDNFQFDSRELSDWYDKHGRQQARETSRIAEAVRDGDLQKAQGIAQRLVFQHPLPVLRVDPTVERRP